MKKQQGFLLPLTIFIVVTMGLFALVLSRNTIQTGTSAAQELISTQTFYAAESGAQRGMQTLFLNANITRAAVDARCVAMTTGNAANNYSFTVDGLKNCSAAVTCTCQFQDGVNCSPITAANYSSAAGPNKLISYYKISSVANCGSGSLRSVRTVEAGSFLKQE